MTVRQVDTYELYRKLSKWLNVPDLPAYLKDELLSMDDKTKEDAFTQTLNSEQLVCVVILVLGQTVLISMWCVKQQKALPN